MGALAADGAAFAAEPPAFCSGSRGAPGFSPSDEGGVLAKGQIVNQTELERDVPQPTVRRYLLKASYLLVRLPATP